MASDALPAALLALTFSIAPPAAAAPKAGVEVVSFRTTSSSAMARLFVRAPGCVFLGPASGQARVESYADDKGRRIGGSATAELREGPGTAPDGAIALRLLFEPAPPLDALKIRFEAEAELNCAVGPKRSHRERTALQAGSVIDAGPFSLKFAPINPTGKAMQVYVSGPFRQLASVKITDPAGSELQYNPAANVVVARLNGSHERFFLQAADAADVELEWYDEVRTISVPLAFETAVGPRGPK